MIKTFRKLTIMVLVVLLITIAAVPAFAAGFDFDAEIPKYTFNKGNTFSLKVGETHEPSYAAFAREGMATCYTSDKAIVTVSAKGTVTAIGEGSAYVAIVTDSGIFEIYLYNISKKNQTGGGDYGSMIQDSFDILSDSDTDSYLSSGLKIFGIFFAVIFSFIAFVFVWLIATFRKCKKLDHAMRMLESNPSQETAEAAVAEFSQISGLVRFNIASGSDTRGVHFTMWREVFNQTVIPCRAIKSETKEALRRALLRLNTHSLYNVIHTEEGKDAAEAFGAAGEANVWHNLKTMLGCDVYRNVRIRNGATSSEIDAILVSEDKGVFLLEVKSIGGIATSDGNKVITYNLLKEDPSNQIYRHESDFISYFSNMDLKDKIKNVLVFSWPHGDTRRWIASNTFPQTDYAIISVEQLIAHFKAQPTVSLSQHEKQFIAAKLRSCSAESIIR